MRSNQQNKRSRGRNNNNNRNKNSNPLTRSYDSNGPDIRVRGNAAHVAEKYMQLARDANATGDSVAAENYLQHAEHYLRLISAAQAQQLAQQQAQAARAESQENRQENRQDNRQNPPVKNVVSSGNDEGSESLKVEEGAGAEGAENVSGGKDTEEKPAGDSAPRAPRERRPRRRPVSRASTPKAITNEDASEDARSDETVQPSSDPANAPQPEVTELPAFVTAEADNSAAE